MAQLMIVTLLAIVALTQSTVVFHSPDTLEVDSKDNNMLFIHEPSVEASLRQELADAEAADRGSYTSWLNMDHPRMYGGATGDYEWVREARYRERAYGECVIPCEDSDIRAMEVDVVDFEPEEDSYIVQNCLGIEDQAYRPANGFFCMNTDQRGPNSKCTNNPVCQDKYMGSNCQCPDFQVKYFCATSSSEQEEYCNRVEDKFTNRGRKRSYFRNVREFAEENDLEVEGTSNVDLGEGMEDKKTLPGPNKKLLQLLRELLDDKN